MSLLDLLLANGSKGLSQCLSCWRVLSTHLRPDPLMDKDYLAERDHKIAESVQGFLHAFAPWAKTSLEERERVKALTVLFEEAASLGIFLFSQPSELRFRLPPETQRAEGSLVVIPALYRITDEHGQTLPREQVLVKGVVYTPAQKDFPEA